MKLTPVRKQYLEIKSQYPDAILFFRLGDFYETFDHDAEVTSQELDIVLTSRKVAKGDRVPMAGIPYHAAENYLMRLIDKGYHVAICEQVGEGPIQGLFPREVVRVVTPGTVLEPGLLPGDSNNYLAAVVLGRSAVGVAYVDVSTGEFAATEIETHEPASAMRQELHRLAPSEIIHPESLPLSDSLTGHLTPLSEWYFSPDSTEEGLKTHLGVSHLDGYGLEGLPLAVRAAGGIVHYLKETQSAALTLLTSLSTYSTADFMVLDGATRRNLELTQTIRSGDVEGSLLGVLDATVSPMGRRTLRAWVNRPLVDRKRIESRLTMVQSLFDNGLLRGELRSDLKQLPDLERITNRALAGVAAPRDLDALRQALKAIPGLKVQLDDERLEQLGERLDPSQQLLEQLQIALVDEPPATLNQTGIFRTGYSEELDGVLEASREARDWIAGLESEERGRTGINSLKVGYNKVFGYYIEVTKANAESVPDTYIRKQTLVNAERYITPEMKEYETRVLSADEEIRGIERALFDALCRRIGESAPRLLEAARAIGELDALSGLAETASRRAWVQPKVVDGHALEIREGRHPVVEEFTPRFVPNDAVLEDGERIRVITGPNMSGKSTYLRQVALIMLMAQMGSFVPARSAKIGLADRIFSRIGAQDEIHAGQSTFMVEMLETANLLHNATDRSLLILDEIGRGTSTYDGLSIAWAVVEFVHSHPRLRSRALVATHYNELTRLAENLPGVRNFNVAVSEERGKVVFLHKIVPGGADKSYGIHVAELAGLPRSVIQRAQELLLELEEQGEGDRDSISSQLPLFSNSNAMLDDLEALSIDELTPLEALNLLYEWQQRLRKSQ
ncbi:MAG: DNA mismatch repair protein MutS [Anaerolineales bacterium]